MNKLIPVISLLAVLMTTAIFLTQSDDSEAEYTENASHLQGTIGYSTNNMTGNVEFVTSDDSTITAFSYRISQNLGNSYTYYITSTSSIYFSVTVTGGGLPTLYWDWNSSDASNIVLWEQTSSGTTYTIPISSTSGLSGGVKFVSVSTSISTPKTITNMDFSSITVSSTDNISNWDCRIHYYTINVRSSDYGTVNVSSVNVPQGSTIWYDSVQTNTLYIQASGSTQTYYATPSTATIQYTYSFTGWTGVASTPTVIASDMSVTANFTRTVNDYTVTFDANPSHGSVSPSSLTVPYGTVITESANTLSVGGTTVTATPNPTDIQYSYSFDSWTIPQSTVEGDMTVTALFTLTVNNYVIGIESSNTAYGTVDESIVYAPYGTAYSVSGNTLTIGTTVITATPTVGDVQYTYSLSGWSVSSGTVTGNMSIVAVFDQTVNNYPVHILTNNDAYGSTNTSEFTAPYGSAITINGNSITVGGIIVSATPSPATVSNVYSFSGWEVVPATGSSTTEVLSEVSIVAIFLESVRQYTVTFSSVPSEFGDVEITYWDGTQTVPISGKSFLADYGSSVMLYSNGNIEVGGYHITPVPSEQEVDYTYVFNNWTIPSNTITGDMSIIANFNAVTNTVITVNISTPYGKLYQDGVEYTDTTVDIPYPSTVSVEDGELHLWKYVFTADELIQTEQWKYTFNGWNGVPTNGETYNGMTISATYIVTDRYYTVTFHIADGFGTLTTERVLVLYNTLIYSENNVIVVGSNTIIATPTPDGDGATYEFVRWDGLPMSGRILEDTDISAKIQRTVTANAFNIVEIEHGEVERVWSIPDEYLPLMLVLPIMLLIGMVLLSLNRKSDDEDYDNY